MNPQRADFTCSDPVMLLREHVLDACRATPTQIPDDRDDLLILELHKRPSNSPFWTRTIRSKATSWTISNGA